MTVCICMYLKFTLQRRQGHMSILLIPNWAICLAHLLYLVEVLTACFALLFSILLDKLIFLSMANLAVKIVACIPPKVPKMLY